MKYALLIVMVASVFSFAGPQWPVLARYSQNGSPNPLSGIEVKCEVFSNKIVIARTFGKDGVTTLSEVPFQMTRNLATVLEAVSKAKVVESPGPETGPSAKWVARYYGKEIRLRCVGPVICSNQAPENIILLNLLDTLCR